VIKIDLDLPRFKYISMRDSDIPCRIWHEYSRSYTDLTELGNTLYTVYTSGNTSCETLNASNFIILLFSGVVRNHFHRSRWCILIQSPRR